MNSGDEQIAALIQFHLGIDPDILTDGQFYKTWTRLEWCLKKEQLKKK